MNQYNVELESLTCGVFFSILFLPNARRSSMRARMYFGSVQQPNKEKLQNAAKKACALCVCVCALLLLLQKRKRWL